MRAPGLRLVASLLVCACSSASGPPDGDSGSAPARFTLSGVVQDSAANRALAGVIVLIGPAADTTDFLGGYSLVVDSGKVATVLVADSRFEPYSTSRVVSAPATVNIPLRRLAPLVKDVSYVAGLTTVTATIVDLQGASTINRGNGSALFYEGPGISSGSSANVWSWTQLDAVSWRVSLNIATSNATRLTWAVLDADGHVGRFECVPGGTCSEMPP